MARYTEATLRFKETKLGGRGRGQKKTETRKRSLLTIRERGEGRRGGEGDLVDSVVVQVQPCCKGKISCRRFVDNGVMAEVCLDASTIYAPCIQYTQEETRSPGSDAVERRKKK